MAQAALYRRYRSKSFADVVGQDHVTTLLDEAVKRGLISHAYLFTGPRGVGKTSVARILAHAINELPYSEDTHLDIIEIDAASNRRIDDIRDLREKVHIAPVSAKYKVYIIDEVHMLTGDSFNALLKTLEEPPAHVVFILATTELQKVPATIISRTQRFQFKPGSFEKMVDHLERIANQEKITIERPALELIARHGEGSFRDSLSLLDQVASSSDKKIIASDVEALLGLVGSEKIVELAGFLERHDMTSAVKYIRSAQAQGTASPTLATQLAKHLSHSAETTQDFHAVEELIEIGKSVQPDLKLLAVIARLASSRHIAEQSKPTPKPATVEAVPVAATKPSEVLVKSAPIDELDEQPAADEQIEVSAEISGDFNWSKVMEMLAKRNPPLHSVLKRADMVQEDNKLVLEFAYALHQKKLEDKKYKTMLTSLITDLFGECPAIVIRKRTAKPPKNPVAAQVADIMGGGEEVNAT